MDKKFNETKEVSLKENVSLLKKEEPFSEILSKQESVHKIEEIISNKNCIEVVNLSVEDENKIVVPFIKKEELIVDIKKDNIIKQEGE